MRKTFEGAKLLWRLRGLFQPPEHGDGRCACVRQWFPPVFFSCASWCGDINAFTPV
jgi:hypothetical protein